LRAWFISDLSFLDKHACGVGCAEGIHPRDRRFPPIRTSRRFAPFPVRLLGALPDAVTTILRTGAGPIFLKKWDAGVFEPVLILAWLLP
jgi:hypothetical protein